MFQSLIVTVVFVSQPCIIFKLCLLCKFLLEVFASRNAAVFYRAAVLLVTCYGTLDAWHMLVYQGNDHMSL